MDRKKMIIAAATVSLALVAVACVTASSQTKSTPLYTYRMEQKCSEMNFLPTEVAEFTYTAGEGYTLGYDAAGCCSDVNPLDTGVWTCYYSTCGGPTCWLTCPASCYGTCNDPTCPVTCQSTCPYTCNTCSTCEYSCGQNTCNGGPC